MSLVEIRDRYGVPAKRGRVITFEGRRARATSADGHHLKQPHRIERSSEMSTEKQVQVTVTMRDAEKLNALRLELPSSVWEDACHDLRDRIGAAVASASPEPSQ